MCLKDLRDEFIYDCECHHLAKGSLRNYKAATWFLIEYGADLLCDDKTKATNFLRLIAFELMIYLVGS